MQQHVYLNLAYSVYNKTTAAFCKTRMHCNTLGKVQTDRLDWQCKLMSSSSVFLTDITLY